MKNKKMALFKSVVSLVLCISMFVGTTFAWFTDEVVSGGNIIASGTLDATMEYATELNGQWTDASTGSIFSYEYWEPGYTDMKFIRVGNAGNLAFRYQLHIIPTNATPEGEANLADVIDVYYGEVTEGFTVPTDFSENMPGMTRIGTLSELIGDVDGAAHGVLLPTSGAQNVTLNPGDEAIARTGMTTACIMLHMQEEAGNEYQNLTVGGSFRVQLNATQYTYENDSFGNDYDTDAGFPMPDNDISENVTVNVTVADNKVTENVTIQGANATAQIPTGVQVSEGTAQLTLTISEKNASESNVTLGENEAMRALDVHVAGVAADNTQPMEIYIREAAPKGLNAGNLKLYHVENGITVEMTAVDTFTAHNQFKYDPATGDVTLYMATFSEVACVVDILNPWNGDINYTWYDDSKTELTIANADQLAGFGAIVGGMNGKTKDSFYGQTVKLISDINLGDQDGASEYLFYPIGYYNSTGSYEKKNGESVTSNVSSFEGTFDGAGHTIANFYQNTWEMFGDYNDGYSGTPNHYKDAMGLFGYVKGGTVKNLTVDHFSSDGEFTPTGVIAAYADGDAEFTNIAITNCNPRVYNTGNGGIIGIAGSTGTDDDSDITLTNITVDNSNKISALWGSWDVACGGLVGMYRGNVDGNGSATGDTIEFNNCHVAAQIDVYNDVCANYQYYAYRYAGMIIGSIRHNTTQDGKTIPNMTGISATGCTVNYGDWNDYYYCEFVKNSIASYTHDYQFSRVPKEEITFDENGNVTGCTHNHKASGTETINGKEVLVEDKTAVYLPFHQLFTGYSWGVSSIGLETYGGIVTNLDITEGDQDESVEKFEGKVTELPNNQAIKLGTIFNFVNNGVSLVPGALTVTVTNLDENNPVSAEFALDTQDWANGTLTLTGVGEVTISIQDYYFCTPTTITVAVKNPEDMTQVDRFAVAFPSTAYMNRVGNVGTVELGKLFTATDGIGNNVTITFETVTGASVDPTTVNATKDNWYEQNVQFSNTGVIKVTISDDNFSKPVTQYLEVVDATNVTSLSGTISGNVVLLNNCGLSTLTVSGRNAVYGNGFTATYTGNGQYLNNGLKQGVVTVSENGMLDNLRIVASIYPAAYMYLSEAKEGPSDGNNRYFYQLSAVAASGNATISNCYIYGARTNIYIGDGNVTVKDSVLECGTLANVQIQSSSSHIITFENVTTIQHQVNATIGDTTKVMLGAGIVVGPETNDNPKIVLKGNFKQYNWVTKDDASVVSNDTAKSIINAAVNATAYNHTVNGKTASNLGIVYMNTDAVSVTNETGLPYAEGNVSMTVSGINISGKVYSLQNATANQIYSDYANADKSTVNDWYQPQFKYSADLGGQYVAKTDDGDEYCYREDDTIKVMFVRDDSKILDLAGLVSIAKYSNQDLNLVITCKDSAGDQVEVNEGKITLKDEGDYLITYTVTDKLYYDNAGTPVSKSNTYSYDVKLTVNLKDKSIQNAEFSFTQANQKYYRTSGTRNLVQFIPFLAGLKITDYDENGIAYTRFDGDDTDNGYNIISDITIEDKDTSNGNGQGKHIVTVNLADGGKIVIDMDMHADSGSSTYTGSIKTADSVVYLVNNGTTNGTSDTKWTIYSYSFAGNNGVEIKSVTQTFTYGGTKSKPTGTFGDSSSDSECVTPDTLITLADGTQMRIDQVTYENELLVWDFFKGEYAVVPSALIVNHGYGEQTIIKLTFDDGTVVKAITAHSYYDADTHKWERLNSNNAHQYIGHEFVQADGDGYTTTKLVDVEIYEEYTESYSLVSAFHYNFITENMFSLTNSVHNMLAGLVVGENMTYDLESDIADYGLYTYDDFADYITYEQYVAFNGDYLRISVEKGYITFDEIMELIETYL